MHRAHTLLVVLLAAILSSPARGQSPKLSQPAAKAPSPSTPRFDHIVLEHFDQWDTDHDGILSADEIDNLAMDPQITGTSAAAISSLKLAARSTKLPCPSLTRAFQQREARPSVTPAPAKRPEAKPAGDDDAADAPVISAAGIAEPPFQSNFNRALGRINRTDRRLFADGTPNLETCRQGPLGDCFFVSVVGAFAARDGRQITDMITETRDGYAVRFGSDAAVTIKPLTDSEIGISSSSGVDGLWLPLLEKAYGTLRLQAKAKSKSDDKDPSSIDEPTDILAHGGSAAATIRALTGHKVNRISLAGRTFDDAERAVKADKSLPALREALIEGVHDHRLMAAGTPGTSLPKTPAQPDSHKKPAPPLPLLPPAVNPNHAYAVLSYDQSSDIITLWNPHRNTFTPKPLKSMPDGTRPTGLNIGYSTKEGKFQMPLSDFARVFSGVSIETDESAQADARK